MPVFSVQVLHHHPILLFSDKPDPPADPGAATDLPAQRPLRRGLLDLVHRAAGNCAR